MEAHRTSSWKMYTFGTWNVRGLKEKKRETFAEIQRENEDVVVLTETKVRGIGTEEFGNYIHLYSGVTIGPSRAGVSILLKKELGDNVEWETINERIIKARLRICGKRIIIIGVYWVDDCAQTSVKDRFQNKLEGVLEGVDKNDEVIILGDFNARVGSATNSGVLGNFGENEVNNNGRRLKELCGKYNLKIQNTFFNHKDMHKYTWYHARQSRRTLIDYCITRQDTTLLVDDVVACRWLECRTDHIFLEATVSFPLLFDDEYAIREYRTYMLYSKTVRTSYKKHLESTMDLCDNRTTNEMYQHLKESIHSAALHVLGFENEVGFGGFLWDAEIRDLRNKRQNLRNQTETLFPNKNISESEFRKIKNEVWDGICSTVDNTNKYRRNKVAWDIVKELQNAPNRNENIQDETSSDAFYKELLKGSRRSFTEFRVENVENFNGINLSKFRYISFAEVSRALSELDDYSVPTPGGLTIKLLRYSSNKAKQLLRKLIQKIFDGEEVPPEINETFITNTLKGNADKASISENGKYALHSIMRIMGLILKDIIEKCNSYEHVHIPMDPYLDVTFVMRQLLQKSAEKRNELFHIAFLDLKNTYADITLSKLFETLEHEGICRRLLSVINLLYMDNNFRIVTSNRLSQKFYAKGLKYGCKLSLVLFKIYIQESLKAWKEENLQNGITIGNRKLISFFFNDYRLVIVAGDKKNLGKAISSLTRHFEDIGLEINLTNVKYLGSEDFKMDKVTIKGEEIMYFQGSILELDGRNTEEVYKRILETKMAIGILHPVVRDQVISKRNKKRIFNSIIRCFLIYGCETWTLTEDLKTILESVEMSYWRWCCENYPDKFTKQTILDLMNVKYDISKIIMLKKTAWYTNIKQMGIDEWPRCILEWKPEGALKYGRPRKKWLDGLEQFLTNLSTYRQLLEQK